MIYETIIIGAGIAGATAAIYAARKRMNYLVISENVGGQMLESGEVLNYPGIQETTGADFASIINKQLKFNKVKINENEKVLKIKKKNGNFIIITNKAEYETQTVILATGARPRKLEVPGEDKLFNKGLTYCSVCDGPLFQGMDVAIVGAGDSALEAVDFMKSIAKKMYLINIGKELGGHEYLRKNIEKIENLTILNETKTVEILGDKMVSGLKYEQNGEVKELKLGGIIIEIGRLPNSALVKNLLDFDDHEHIKIDCTTETSLPGIFAAGDCTDIHEYQYTISAGQGCTALLKVARYLAGKKQK